MHIVRLSLLTLFIDLGWIRGARVTPIWGDTPERKYLAQFRILGRWRSVGHDSACNTAGPLHDNIADETPMVFERPAKAWALIQRLGQ